MIDRRHVLGDIMVLGGGGGGGRGVEKEVRK